MPIADIFSVGDVVLDLDVGGKRAVLAALAEAAATRLDRPPRDVLDALVAREALGSTALGLGAALPHAELPRAPVPVMLFARLRRPIEFDAPDGEGVDLVVLVLWPDAAPDRFLAALAETCRSLRAPHVLRRLRSASTPEEVVALLAGPSSACAPDGPGTP